MQIGHAFVGVVTEKLAETRKFYTRFLGFRIVCDMDWYLHLADPSGRIEVGFLAPNHPTQPQVFQQRFQSPGGVWICLEVPDAEAEYRRLSAARAPMAVPLADEPWGERHFVLLDPSGVPLNIAQRIPADPSFVSEAFAAMPEPATEAFADEIDEAAEDELELETEAGDDVTSAAVEAHDEETPGEPETQIDEHNVDSLDEEYALEPPEAASEPPAPVVEEPAAPPPSAPEPPRPEPPLPWSPFAPGEPLPAGVYIQEPSWRRPPEPVIEPSAPAGDAAFELIGETGEEEPAAALESESNPQDESPAEVEADSDAAPEDSIETFSPVEPENAIESEVVGEFETITQEPVVDDGDGLAETPLGVIDSEDANSEAAATEESLTAWEPPVEADLVEASEPEQIPPYAAADDEPEVELELEPRAEQADAEATALGPDFDFAESDLKESDSSLEEAADKVDEPAERPVENFETAGAEATIELSEEVGGLAEEPNEAPVESLDFDPGVDESSVPDVPSAEAESLVEEESPAPRPEPGSDEEVMLDDYGSVVHFQRQDEPGEVSSHEEMDNDSEEHQQESDAELGDVDASESDDSEEWKLRFADDRADEEDDLPLI